jgi:deferrochelatase/peroxidase EfeB
VDLDDIQGLVRFGYKRHREACFILLRVRERAAACRWLAQCQVASAVASEPPPATALQVALTAEGLLGLGVPAGLVAGFAEEFVGGMAGDPNRSRRLGDLGPSDPGGWDWGLGERSPHVLLLLYALPGLLDGWRATVERECAAGFDRLALLCASDLGGVEPFGFADGLSQPEIDWGRRRPVEDRVRPEYGNLTCLGEFLLGYPNEYGLYTERPLLSPDLDPSGLLPRAEDRPGLADLGRNGSYLALRQLRQDVLGFWQYLRRESGGDLGLARRWAESMVGRTLDGRPLVPSNGVAATGGTIGAPDLNAFDYDRDPEGLRCPLGAHVRRANPRTGDLPPGGPSPSLGPVSRLLRTLGLDPGARARDLVASTRFHRLLRRGREYGPRVDLEQAFAGLPVTGESGLHFICLAANLGRQFEFVQSAWLAGTRFAGLPGEGDPLLGHRVPGRDGEPTDRFSIPRPDGPDLRLCHLPHFVNVRGGAYFFLPGIRALRCLAQIAEGGTT